MNNENSISRRMVVKSSLLGLIALPIPNVIYAKNIIKLKNAEQPKTAVTNRYPAIGAASHVGRKDIVDYLLSMGARPDVFAYAMLGAYEIVKSMIVLSIGFIKCRPLMRRLWYQNRR